MDTRTDSKIHLLLRILRNPFVSILVLYNLLLYVQWSGNTYILTFPSGLGYPLFFASGIFTGAFVIGNLLLVYLSYAHFVERRLASELALPHLGRELGIGLLLGFGLVTICILIAMALGLYRMEGINSWQTLVAITGGTFSTPVGEELVFRGVMFRIFEGMFGGWLALVLSSLGFGLIHLSNEGETFLGVAAIVLVFGPMLAVPYMLTRRLWMSIGLHMAWNYTMGKVYSINVSGNEAAGLLKTTVTGPEWLTGGNAGLEGSLIAMLVSIAFSVVVLILAVRRGKIVPPSWKHKAGVGVR
ncbi:MAG: CPBP family intramembrane metalloprotease [Elainella sp. Prado103]|nr:CPBP family intramembrane metalloprotease [Elainella sp. Prado103]